MITPTHKQAQRRYNAISRKLIDNASLTFKRISTMKDKRSNELVKGCKLQSELFADGIKLSFDGIDTLQYPDSSGGVRGGTIKIDQEFLLDSHWVVVEYPSNSN